MRAAQLLGIVAGVALAPSPARAERPWTGYIPIPHAAPPSAVVSSRLIYMRQCPQGGCFVQPGTDDSRTQTSSLAQGARTIGAYTQGPVVWSQLMACMRKTYAPFDINVVDVDPGNVPHFEEIVGGHPIDLRDDIPGAGGVAPFDCSEIPNAISFTFDVYGPDPLSLCWTAAQETAHAFGLQHEYLQKSPMTYLGGDLPKMFQAVDAQCGRYMVEPCTCGSPTQNSYALLLALLGPGAPTPPDLAITQPPDGKKVQPGFEIRATAMDDVAVDRVELWIDGAMTDMIKTAPYNFVAPALDLGAHAIEVRAYDVQDTQATAAIGVDLGPPCTAGGGCDGQDVCVEGQCISGPDVPGGLGSVCQTDNECLSHICADGGEALHRCVAGCDLGTAGACPSDFTCLSAGATGVCWMSGGGCCDAGPGPQGPLVLALGVVAIVLRRRRR
jgi:hypothetical protein